MMLRPLLALVAAALLRTAAAAAPADYAYTFPIDTGTAGASSAWRVELTPEVYAWTRDADLRDLAIFNAAGQPVAFARLDAAPEPVARERFLALPTLALPAAASGGNDLRLVIDRDADGRLRRIDAGEQAATARRSRDWLIDASTLDRAVDGFELEWTEPKSGVSARFSIAAGDDLQDWRELGNGSVLALEQNGMRIDRRTLAFEPVRARYFRLRRLDDGVDLDGLSAQARSTDRTQSTAPLSWLRAEPVAANGATTTSGGAAFDYALPAALPVESVRIELAGDNALAPLALSAGTGDPTQPWRPLVRLDAFRLRQGEQVLHNDDVDLPPGRVREWRIEARTPLAAAPRLTLGYRPDTLVFLAEGTGPYVLAAGSRQARHPDYPVAAALASLRAELGRDWQPPRATLGAARIGAGEAALREPEPPLPWRRWLLWGVLAAGAALVGGFALSLLRERKRDPQD
jgi:hypothetical protein